ncbi:hypothetical protein ACU8KH_00627 [Lachancea thermotolerans]
MPSCPNALSGYGLQLKIDAKSGFSSLNFCHFTTVSFNEISKLARVSNWIFGRGVANWHSKGNKEG